MGLNYTKNGSYFLCWHQFSIALSFDPPLSSHPRFATSLRPRSISDDELPCSTILKSAVIHWNAKQVWCSFTNMGAHVWCKMFYICKFSIISAKCGWQFSLCFLHVMLAETLNGARDFDSLILIFLTSYLEMVPKKYNIPLNKCLVCTCNISSNYVSKIFNRNLQTHFCDFCANLKHKAE
jgi:hypothetical protein